MRRIPMLIVLLVVFVGLASPGGTQDSAVTFSVEEARIDLGEIKAGSEAVATFGFHNKGDADVKIIKAKPS